MVERLIGAIGRRPRAFDFVVMLVWGLLSFASDELWDQTDLLAWSLPLTGVAGIALYWRRRQPMAVFLSQGFIVLFMTLIDVEASVPIALLCGTYSLAAHNHDRQRSIAAFAGLLTLGFLIVLLIDIEYLPDTAFIAITLAIAWVTGDSMRTRRAYQRSVLERAERAEALRDSLAHQAVAEERTRIARDLHDVVAHSMSLMVVQAGAARRVAKTDPEASITALEAIESVGRNSLDEMRRILGVLRGDESGAAIAPQPDIAAIDALVDEFRVAGLAVDLSYEGNRRELAASIELTAFRIVQESLTNTLKHAGPAVAQVTLDFREAELVIIIEDNGTLANRTATTEPGSQKGHVGMRERVAAFDGSFSARPRLGGGYRVEARLPHTGIEQPPEVVAEGVTQ